jgi:hypothetical protein
MLETTLIVLVSGIILFQIFVAYKVFQYTRHRKEKEASRLNAASKIAQLIGLVAAFSLFMLWRYQ